MLAVMFLPDPAELLAVADRISGHAGATRVRAAQVAGAVDAVDWQGIAAAAFRTEAAIAIHALRAAASRLDEAADALRRHARNVQVLCADAVRLGEDALRTAGDAALHPDHLLADGAHVISDAAHLFHDALSVFGI